jgi:hypothetical protein
MTPERPEIRASGAESVSPRAGKIGDECEYFENPTTYPQ